METTETEVCPECSLINSVYIDEDFPCPLCDGIGKVEKGTKTWLENLLKSK